MAQTKLKQQKYKSLSDILVNEEWTEMTGPFFYVKTDDGKTYGPFHPQDISDYIDENGLPTQTQIKDAKGLSDWQNLYTHALFQRRKPSLVPTGDATQIDSLMILRDGKPHGPLGIQEIETLIENKGLISTDAVSIDQGRTWVKLYQVPGFDQRTYSAAELPVNPGKNSDLPIHTESNKASEQMANLVYIESQKQNPTAHNEESNNDQEKSSSNFKGLLIIGFLLAAIVGYFFFNDSSQTNLLNDDVSIETQENIKDKVKKAKINARAKAKAKTKAKTKAKIAPVKKAKVRKPAKAAVKKKTPQAKMPRTRKPKSFTTTPAYQDRKKLEDDPTVEDNYYDDGDIENDPVRKAVSKETLFPEEAELLEPEAEIDIYKDEEADFERDESEIISAEDSWDKNDGNRDPFEEE